MLFHNSTDHIIIDSRYCIACFKYIEVYFNNMLNKSFTLFYKHVHMARPAADIGCLHVYPRNVIRLK